ncbi:hypothetical protein D1872_329630 [compost metagenome]
MAINGERIVRSDDIPVRLRLGKIEPSKRNNAFTNNIIAQRLRVIPQVRELERIRPLPVQPVH